MQTHRCSCGAVHPWDGRPETAQIIGGREVPEGPIDAAKEYISLTISALATARDEVQKKEAQLGIYSKRNEIQEVIDELGTAQWHVISLGHITHYLKEGK